MMDDTDAERAEHHSRRLGTGQGSDRECGALLPPRRLTGIANASSIRLPPRMNTRGRDALKDETVVTASLLPHQ